MTDEVKAYAEKILQEHRCNEYSYYGVNGEEIIRDLKEAYPDGMKYPYIDVANAIMLISKPKLITRSPYRMIFDLGHTVDGIDFDTLEEAQDDAIETLINWMCDFYSEHHISEPDKTKWTEEQQEDWDMMINECSTCVAQYDPDKDEYKVVWYPSGQKKKEIGWEYINP